MVDTIIIYSKTNVFVLFNFVVYNIFLLIPPKGICPKDHSK